MSTRCSIYYDEKTDVHVFTDMMEDHENVHIEWPDCVHSEENHVKIPKSIWDWIVKKIAKGE